MPGPCSSILPPDQHSLLGGYHCSTLLPRGQTETQFQCAPREAAFIGPFSFSEGSWKRRTLSFSFSLNIRPMSSDMQISRLFSVMSAHRPPLANGDGILRKIQARKWQRFNHIPDWDLLRAPSPLASGSWGTDLIEQLVLILIDICCRNILS